MSSLFSALKIPQLSNFCQAKRSRGTFVSFWFGRMESRNFCIEFLVRGRDPPHSLPQREVPSRQPPRVTNKHTTYTTHTYTYMNIKEMEEKKWLLFSLFLVCFLFLFCPLCVGGEEEQNINFEKNWEVEWGWEGGMKKGGWRERRQDVMCYPLLLDNECGEVLDGTNVPPPAQEARFNLFAQSISDARMVPAGCRRPLVWFTCTAGMDLFDCSNQTSRQDENDDESEGDRIFAWCEQVNDLCGNSLNCTQLATLAALVNGVAPPSPDGTATDEIPDEFEAIPVSTCQNGNEELDCCFAPYARSDDGECVVGCGKVPNFSDAKQQTNVILAKILLWGGMGLIFIFVIPFLFTENFFKFPNYALPLSFFFQIILINVLFWSVYTGDPTDNYFCRGAISLGEALNELTDSVYCPLQFTVYGYFLLVTLFWQLVIVIMLINVAYRNNVRYFNGFFSLFHSPQYLRRTEIVCHVVIYSVSAMFAIPTGILVNDRDLLGASPPLYICWKGGEDIALLMWIPLLSILIIDCIGLSFVISLWMCRNVMLLKIHWRLVAVLVHNIFVFGMANVSIWYMGQKDAYGERVGDYAACTTQNPNEDGVCSLEEGIFWYWFFFYIILMSWPIASCLFVYGTNPFCRKWWVHLFKTRTILREGDQQGGKQTTPVKRMSKSGNGSSSSSFGAGVASGSGSGSGSASGSASRGSAISPGI